MDPWVEIHQLQNSAISDEEIDWSSINQTVFTLMEVVF
jgi:hypothetical protein